jgi:hypothetical protein
MKPKRNPPTWAKKATPPLLPVVERRLALASMTWYTNHDPRKNQAESLTGKITNRPSTRELG